MLSGIDNIEYIQLSGVYNDKMLCPGYFNENGEWVRGEEEQDFKTIVDNSLSFGLNGFDDSFSFTDAENSELNICSYSLNGSVSVPESITFDWGYALDCMPVVSIGFEVLDDIENIYDAFEWNSKSTMVSESMNDKAYYLDNGLTISCNHKYEKSTVPNECENMGYDLYSCLYCNHSYKCNFIPAFGHYYVVSKIDDKGKVFYVCKNCNGQTEKTINELYQLWDIKYINKKPQNTSLDYSCYLDLVNDNVINAKDFAVLCNN